MQERSNDEWLAALAAADAAAVAELREYLRRGLHRAVGTRSGADPDRIEDFAQDAVMKVLTGLASFRGESRFLTWALAVGTRVAFSELRKARYRDVSLDATRADGRTVPEPAVTPDAPAAGDDVLATIRHLIDTELTEKQRAVILAELDGVPQAVLVERFATNRNALYKMSHDARMKLKRALEAAGVTADEVRGGSEAASQ
jgi:RNA polymerase sigma-70 factor (ECF subfamily)